MAPSLHIGTSGWHYPHWIGPFYPSGLAPSKWLAFYARHFDTVEINRTFYRLPGVAAVRQWEAATYPGFIFALKGSRYLTHMKKLKEAEEGIQAFLPLLAELGEKAGPVLFQLPPRWRCNLERLDEFLSLWPASRRCALELRDPDWHRPETLALLRRHNAAFCIYNLAGFSSPCWVTADFAYVRLHGPEGAYCGCYSRQQLGEWADRIRAWSELRDVYVYFDNDENAYAVRNALELRELLA